MTTRYIPHIIYTVAITSISTHMLWHRKESDDQRRHVDAHVALLERLRSASSRLPEAEVREELERIRRTFRRSAEELERDRAVARGLVRVEGEGRESIGWKEALLGGAAGAVGGGERREAYERADLEKVRKEIEESTS
ncbi:hypothetical protein EIP91_007767 [Steccherinum ochraceum]|uniref:Uncharacterized protein n=1 Tax=Steccherinum ochraceum TaxID=92696 RepID=A0A4R0RL20_9APHY|nr:hypothetical protein EIP91_007767 [Steccherinum ochraceum]